MTTASRDLRYPPWSSSIPPAPGDLRLVQAFVNTLDVEAGTDEIDSPAALGRWLTRWRLLGRSVAVSETEWRQAVDLREGLRGLLLANNGVAAELETTARLRRALGDIPLRCQLGPDAAFDLVAVGGGWPAAAARLLTLVTRAMADGSWCRLKACPNDACHWIFFDASKNRSGKWCAMARCGDVMKARAYRRRRQRGANTGSRRGA